MQNVILLGAGRSGTKFTRSIIAANGQVFAVPYDVGYIWRGGLENWPDDALPAERLTPESISRIRNSLYRQAKLPETPGDNVIFLEKSVPNTLRVPYVSTVFPDARFIHLIRDGRDVVESAYRNWQKPPSYRDILKKLRRFPWTNWRYAVWYMRNRVRGLKRDSESAFPIWGPRYPGIDDDTRRCDMLTVVARQWRMCVEHSVTALADVAPENVLEVRYENLIKDEGEVLRIADFLGISRPEPLVNYYRQVLIPASERRPWDIAFSAEEKALVLEEIGETLTNLGYALA